MTNILVQGLYALMIFGFIYACLLYMSRYFNWTDHSGQVFEKPESLRPNPPSPCVRDVKKGFDKLAEASNGCWDNIDAEEFVDELRFSLMIKNQKLNKRI